MKCRLSTAFHPQTDGQTDGQTKRQDSTIKVYLRGFVNFEHNNWGKFLPMAKFTYKNAKNASTGHMPFKLNCSYHPRVFFEEDINLCSKLKTAKELSSKRKELIAVCWENLYYAQELQKWAYNKGVGPRSYVPSDKIWLNSKYTKTKQNPKLETKFFRPFWVLYPIGKQAYKFKLSKKWRVYNMFHVSLLEQNTTRKGWMSKEVSESDAGNEDSKEYEVEAIWDRAVYANKLESGYPPGLYYWIA